MVTSVRDYARLRGWSLGLGERHMTGGSLWAVLVGLAWMVIVALLAGCETATHETPSSPTLASTPVPAAGSGGAATPAARAMPAPAFYAPAAQALFAPPEPGSERYPEAAPNPVRSVTEHPVSTFSADVDTASYAVARRFLREGRLPPRAAVRVEEMINYFPYAHPAPQDATQPFRITTSTMVTPWNPDTRLLHVGIKGYDLPRAARPRLNLVLLVDVSGSMAPADRLPLLRDSFRLFVQELRDDDRVAIVTYANGVQTLLEPTPGRDRAKVVDAIDGLRAGGGTAGSDGIQRAYALAERHFEREAVNRVVLATDGDFNLGISDLKRLEDYIADKRKTGIYLTILGVGLGNLNDALMQRLAQAGNGNAAYIDSLLEARKVLVEEMASTVFPIANDMKIQVEFNPAQIAEYRLIGYETRQLKREDFKNDRVDAGDIGAGHTVTALYEVVPAGSPAALIEPLRYQPAASTSGTGEYAFVRIRYKRPGENESRLVETPVPAAGSESSLDLRFAAAVAAFGQLLRGEPHLREFGFDEAAALADGARGNDAGGYRAELVQLVRLAKGLKQVVRP